MEVLTKKGENSPPLSKSSTRQISTVDSETGTLLSVSYATVEDYVACLERNSFGVSRMYIQFVGLINLCLGGLVFERKGGRIRLRNHLWEVGVRDMHKTKVKDTVPRFY